MKRSAKKDEILRSQIKSNCACVGVDGGQTGRTRREREPALTSQRLSFKHSADKKNLLQFKTCALRYFF